MVALGASMVKAPHWGNGGINGGQRIGHWELPKNVGFFPNTALCVVLSLVAQAVPMGGGNPPSFLDMG